MPDDGSGVDIGGGRRRPDRRRRRALPAGRHDPSDVPGRSSRGIGRMAGYPRVEPCPTLRRCPSRHRAPAATAGRYPLLRRSSSWSRPAAAARRHRAMPPRRASSATAPSVDGASPSDGGGAPSSSGTPSAALVARLEAAGATAEDAQVLALTRVEATETGPRSAHVTPGPRHRRHHRLRHHRRTGHRRRPGRRDLHDGGDGGPHRGPPRLLDPGGRHAGRSARLARRGHPRRPPRGARRGAGPATDRRGGHRPGERRLGDLQGVGRRPRRIHRGHRQASTCPARRPG